MPTASAAKLDLSAGRARTNLSTPELIERALARGEGRFAENGALVVMTGDRTGRSPTDKWLEDTDAVHEHIWWGKVNQAITPEQFDTALRIATEYVNGLDEVFVFDGFAGADTQHRLGVRVVTELAWHALFAETLFIKPGSPSDAGDGSWKQDWTVINAGCHKLTEAEQKELGLDSPILIAQSLEKKTVVILGTQYAGEMKKGIFYAMNYDMPDQGVFPMHCSANIAKDDPANVALFFGLSGTGKTTLSADPGRSLIGDDEHGWGPDGVFNFEGGCYAKCIDLTREGEPQIWDAMRFGSVLENVIMDEHSRVVDFTDASVTQNTRVTYPVDYIPGATIPSVGAHPKNVIFLTADAFGVIPPVSRLTPEQAMYYFVNGYTSKLAGTEAGVTEPVPNFSPCFGGPFMPRRPGEYAKMLAERINKHGAHVWLLNTGWTGGPYGTGHRFGLAYTRAMVTAILNGTLAEAGFETEPYFGLQVPKSVPGVPDDVLHPENTWGDKESYKAHAKKLAQMFRENDQKFQLSDEVRASGPRA